MPACMMYLSGLGLLIFIEKRGKSAEVEYYFGSSFVPLNSYIYYQTLIALCTYLPSTQGCIYCFDDSRQVATESDSDPSPLSSG